MFKILIFAFVAVQVNLSYASDFDEYFTRLIREGSDPENKLYGATSDGSKSNQANSLSFSQKLDHFKSTSNLTWDQRAFVLNAYYEKPGPFFIYLFGNEEASENWLRGSQLMSYAKEHKALVIGLEHRYYGESRPFKNTSLENLNQLNIQQALADVAFFIKTVNEISIVPSNTKWIAFGGFYGGSLAAWARSKYPHLVHGAVASSALISIKSEFPEYLESVRTAYLNYNKTCGRNIEDGFQQLSQSLDFQQGRTDASRQFKLCNTLNYNIDDIAVLKSIVSDVISTAVEQNQNARFSMATVCETMNKEEPSKMENLGNVIRRYLQSSEYSCFYVERKRIISLFKEYRYDQRFQSRRLWIYQLCTQLGLNLASTQSVDMFGEYQPEIESTAKLCTDVFGPEFNQQTIDDGVEEINIEFGASAYNTSRAVFVSGSLDPWKSAGILKKSEGALYEVVSIEGASHRATLERFPQNANLLEGIRKINHLLKTWLA